MSTRGRPQCPRIRARRFGRRRAGLNRFRSVRLLGLVLAVRLEQVARLDHSRGIGDRRRGGRPRNGGGADGPIAAGAPVARGSDRYQPLDRELSSQDPVHRGAGGSAGRRYECGGSERGRGRRRRRGPEMRRCARTSVDEVAHRYRGGERGLSGRMTGTTRPRGTLPGGMAGAATFRSRWWSTRPARAVRATPRPTSRLASRPVGRTASSRVREGLWWSSLEGDPGGRRERGTGPGWRRALMRTAETGRVPARRTGDTRCEPLPDDGTAPLRVGRTVFGWGASRPARPWRGSPAECGGWTRPGHILGRPRRHRPAGPGGLPAGPGGLLAGVPACPRRLAKRVPERVGHGGRGGLARLVSGSHAGWGGRPVAARAPARVHDAPVRVRGGPPRLTIDRRWARPAVRVGETTDRGRARDTVPPRRRVLAAPQ